MYVDNDSIIKIMDDDDDEKFEFENNVHILWILIDWNSFCVCVFVLWNVTFHSMIDVLLYDDEKTFAIDNEIRLLNDVDNL